MTGPPLHSVADLALRRVPAALELAADTRPLHPLVFVDLGREADPFDVEAALGWQQDARTTVVVGIAERGVAPGLGTLARAVDCTLVGGDEAGETDVAVADVTAARQAVAAAVQAAPRAAATLAGLLRLTAVLDVESGLVAESQAYSMLLSGPEFARWSAGRTPREHPPTTEPAVIVERDGNRLVVELNRPQRHNAFGRAVRDGLADALDLATADDTVAQILLRGRGASFCSGGDLDEFGTAPDPVLAHLIRLDRSVALRLHRCRERAVVEVHGVCIGAGVELPSFAARVVAHAGTHFSLPELSMGLVPGAGGTVSLTRRIGRWRTAYLALTGARVDVATALRWGLVDGDA